MNCGEVHVAIWARRKTVSSGNLMERSSAEATNVSMDQLLGLMAGSMPTYCLRKRGVDVAISVGSEEVRNVMGIRCSGVSQVGESVRTVASNDLGP